jgi:hypothetical protein
VAINMRVHPPASRPHDALDELIVTDTQGNSLAERRIPGRLTGGDGWDRALFTVGYQRVSDWQRSLAGLRCRSNPSIRASTQPGQPYAP